MQKSNLEGLKRGGIMGSSRIESYQNNLNTSICGLRVYPNQDSAESLPKNSNALPGSPKTRVHNLTTGWRKHQPSQPTPSSNICPIRKSPREQTTKAGANCDPRIFTYYWPSGLLLTTLNYQIIIKLYKGQCIKDGRLVMIPTLYFEELCGSKLLHKYRWFTKKTVHHPANASHKFHLQDPKHTQHLQYSNYVKFGNNKFI